MRRSLALLLMGAILCVSILSPAAAQGIKSDPLNNCNLTQSGGITPPQESNSVASGFDKCSALVCSALRLERDTFYNQLNDYPVALDEPFEEIFIRLKGGLQNYANTLEGICGVEVNPLPLCGSSQSAEGNSILNTFGSEAATIRTRCNAEVEVLMDIADTVIRELLLRLASDQKTHAYARRIDALTVQFQAIIKMVELIGNYLGKISLPTVVGDAPKS